MMCVEIEETEGTAAFRLLMQRTGGGDHVTDELISNIKLIAGMVDNLYVKTSV